MAVLSAPDPKAHVQPGYYRNSAVAKAWQEVQNERPKAKAKSESLAAGDAEWFSNTQPDSHSSDGGSPKGWKGSGRESG